MKRKEKKMEKNGGNAKNRKKNHLSLFIQRGEEVNL
jgi:hypothetical protein